MVKMTLKEERPMHTKLRSNQLYVTVDLLILTIRENRLNLLLSRRQAPPFEGRWALPGKFIAVDESAETAARKLLEEMLPLPEAYLEQLYTFTEVDRDPRGRVISTAYLVIVPFSRLKKLPESAAVPFHAFRVKTEDGLELDDGLGNVLTENDLAFDHGRIARTGILRLRGKIDYTEIGFQFLENRQAFSLSELQTVFEAVLDTGLDSSNFRRGILARYERSGQLAQTSLEEKRGRGRPAALYCLKE